MKRTLQWLYLVLFAILCSLAVTACSTPKEGCYADPSSSYEKKEFWKNRKRKKSKSGLFSKKQRKRMRKQRSE